MKILDCLLKILHLQQELHLLDANIETLQQFLPASPIYHHIKDLDVPSPPHVWKECCAIRENQKQEYVTKEIQSRRMRLGADPPEVIRFKVEAEALEKYPVI